LSRIVLDASVALSWCFRDESGPAELEILEQLSAGLEALVPAVWPFEILNGCLAGERRGRITLMATLGFLRQLEVLPIISDSAHPFSRTFAVIADISRNFRLSSYDTAYLELALREGLPLLTVDMKLLAAARKAGLSTALPR
jgi:predicted nucleic acid-binding protein